MPPRSSIFEDEFRDDLAFWVGADRKVALKILELVEEIMRDPFSGIGKPEPLRNMPSGTWSRRITQEHRLVYVVTDRRVDFVACRYHY